jgi:uncharacterized protein (TIGR02217 family)
MLDFIEERLELGYDFGCVGGPAFKTDIVETVGGEEQRNCNWWLPLGRWQLGERMLLDSDIEGIKEVEYLRLFHTARKGSTQGFRFKDWADYRVVGQVLGTSDGITTQWQLKKTYLAGLESFHRPITKPVQGTVVIYLNGNVVTYPLVNYETGLVSFAVPPNTGSIVSCDFEFDVPVTFEKDEIEWSIEAVRLETGETLHRLGSVFVEEIRLSLPIEWYHRDMSVSIAEPLDLGIILETSESILQSSLEQGLSSGFKSKKSTTVQTKVAIKLPTIQCTQIELNKILSYFWVARGRLLNWQLQLNNKLREVRFDSDSLSIKFSASSTDDKLFEVSNLVYLGILEEQPSILYADSILVLPGNNYTDLSPLNKSVSGSSMAIVNNSFSFNGFGSYLRIHSGNSLNLNVIDFNFESSDFSIAVEAYLLSLKALNVFGGMWSVNTSTNQFFRFLLTNTGQLRLNLITSTNTGINVVGTVPDSDYLNSFQSFKCERVGNLINLYYKGQQLVSQNIGNIAIKTITNQPYFIGRHYDDPGQAISGYLKNINVERPDYL